ncbi:MAG: hypothetical protein IJL12_04535 [Selenomonadaceae bacterium]|nr:hypothetical protein [Selenomonadaceae bacterium]MBQ6131589.1 hypothetical protein [Selenomonadaceae bacterium]
MISDEEILERGMDCLMDNLGIIEAERFVSLVWKERDKYNKWKQEYDNMSDEEWLAGLEEFIKQHPDDNNFAKERAL